MTATELGLTKVSYSVEETLSITSLKRTSLYKQLKLGNLKATRCGGRTYFLAVDIAAFLTKLRGEA